ncbi:MULTISPECIES: indolepyruvate ferredoxin oxidoreductase subunit alpha [unclassified Azospirillum]|uniref:thiamine pyrophosphate-dependent enzyme n=1 Tax=unclassified Azospirillum TaxID=2630922 RepID=UPI000B62E363|nr:MULTISPECIES: indolepyruvate ferredoxin oxidoreductase subunit alpha [unclassified Azospirillum]SNS66824.1 indolepyruvate ferredoxin oxidoreductase alpha subunit [Azospirillum sp. RU38E]SNS85063.1 indolepyruvate ferredoxin oxidoreductase alpha subunit [Azospirillum sp. RU37A]
MAERSFAKEVEHLRLGDGEVFRGEAILAITKGLLQAGVSYVGGYQGSPISHLMDVLADAKDILGELGVNFQSSANEATAAAMLSASVMYPLRGAVAWKSTVGTNVASDALANLASGGVTGGTLVIIGEDYGEGSSIMQERTHAFAMKSQMWLLDPRPDHTCIVDLIAKGFELSEASNTPVMLEVRVRTCHMHGHFVAKDNVRPAFSLDDALNTPKRDLGRIVLPPAAYEHEQEKIARRLPAAIDFVRRNKLNEWFGPADGCVGIILQGGMYNNVIRALQYLGLSDAYGNTQVPLYVMNVTYPLIDSEVAEFVQGKDAVLIVEEGQPDYLEQALNTVLRRRDIQTPLHGKDVLPMAGDYTIQAIMNGVQAFLDKRAPQLLGNRPPVPDARPVLADPKVVHLKSVVPPRPPGLCTGCPERPIFAAMKLVQQELGEHHVSADIGCHLFSILPPFNIGTTTMGFGLGAASSAAFSQSGGKRSIAVMGDGGFWHNGLTSGIGNAVFNKHDGVFLIVDNFYSSATGGQDILSSRAPNKNRKTNNPISKAVAGVGATWVREVDRTYDVGRMRAVLKEALTTKEEGPKIIIASSECMLNRQRREKPLVAKAIKGGQRVVKERFGVDEDVCTGDHACIRLSGCPSLSVKQLDDPLRDDPVAAIDNSCVACGNCGEVSEAAALCPSFYRAEVVHNPTGWDRFKAKLSMALIGFLQQRRDRRRIVAEAA